MKCVQKVSFSEDELVSSILIKYYCIAILGVDDMQLILSVVLVCLFCSLATHM